MDPFQLTQLKLKPNCTPSKYKTQYYNKIPYLSIWILTKLQTRSNARNKQPKQKPYQHITTRIPYKLNDLKKLFEIIYQEMQYQNLKKTMTIKKEINFFSKLIILFLTFLEDVEGY